MTDPERWQDRAECLTAPPDLFFPERAEGAQNLGTEAKAFCARCPVADRCLDAAVARREKHGVWGGAGEPTRRRLGKLAVRPRTIVDHPDRCACEYHVAARAHLAAVARAFTRSGNVVHGRWESYVHAGCRCRPCTDAHAATGRLDDP